MYPVGHKIENPILRCIGAILPLFTWWAHASESKAEGEDDVRWRHRNPERKIPWWHVCEQIHTRRFSTEWFYLPPSRSHSTRWQSRFAFYITQADANKQQTPVQCCQPARWSPQQATMIYALTGASCRPEAFGQQSDCHHIAFLAASNVIDWIFLPVLECISHWLDAMGRFVCLVIPNNCWSKPSLQPQWRATCARLSQKLSFGLKRSHTCMHLSNSWLHGRCQTFRLLFLTWTGILCWKSQTSHLVTKW